MRLEVPERPLRPLVYEHELQCLTDDAYERLHKREAIYEEHLEALENVIKSTH